MTFPMRQPILDAKRVAAMTQHMTVEQISERFNVQIGDLEDMLAEAGLRGSGKWVLEDQKTGRHWRCFTEKGCYLKAQMLGLTDYNFGRAAGPTPAMTAPVIEPGDINSRIAELHGRGLTLAKIGLQVGMSAPAVLRRLKKMEGRK